MVFLLPFLSAALWMLSFVQYRLGFLVLVAFIPILFLLHTLPKSKKARREFVFSIWLAGFVSLLGIMAWILSTQPGSWAGIDQKVPFVFVLLVWLISGLAMSVGPLLFAFLVTRFKKLPLFGYRTLLILPTAWMLGEYVRSWFFSLVWYGVGGTIGAHWQFGSFGLGLATTPLLPISRLIGLYGLSFVAIVVNILIFWLIKKRWQLAIPALGGLLLVLVVCIVGYRGTSKTVTVGAVQLATGQADYGQQLAQIINNKHAGAADIVALPEYADFVSPQDSDTGSQVRDAVFQNKQIGLGVDSEGINQADISALKQRIDRSYFFDRNGTIIASQDKTFLIPNGEYLAGMTRWLLETTGHDKLVSNFNTSRALKKAAQPEQVISYGGLRVGALACSGIVSPELYRRLSDADVLMNNASLGIFRSTQYFEQVRALARFDAVANNRPFVQAARSGYSYIISPNGTFVAETKTKDLDYISAGVHVPSGRTLYSRIGELFFWIALVVCIVLLAKDRKFIIGSKRK